MSSRWSILILAAVVAVANSTAARGNAPLTASPIDVALTYRRELIGRCQVSGGQVVVRAPVNLSQQGAIIAQVSSGADGTFLFPNVAPGVYELRSMNWRRTVRVWDSTAAPPAARKSPVILFEQAPSQLQPARRWNEFAASSNDGGSAKRTKPQTELVSWTEPAPDFRDVDRTGPADGSEISLVPVPGFLDPAGTVSVRDGAINSMGCLPEIPQPGTEYVVGAVPMPSSACCPEVGYAPRGPTVGEVISATAIIGGGVLAGIWIYEETEDDDRVRPPVSP